MDQKVKRTIFEMLLGVGIYTVILEAAGLLLTRGPKAPVVLGTLLGAVLAAAMTMHMGNTLDISMDMGEEGAKRKIVVSYLIRWILAVVVFVVAYFSGFFNMLAVFFGLLGLKAGAYLQPLIHKVFGHNEEV